MCGLFGVHSSTLSKDEIQRSMTLGILSLFRGTDATGMSLAYKNEKTGKRQRPIIYNGFKHPIDSFGFLQLERVDKLLRTTLPKLCIMGHTRSATSGSSTARGHAHPHQLKHVIGCHNGTIFRFNCQANLKKLGTDSRVLFNMIAEEGVEEALKEADWGAYAISFYDTRANTITFARNNDRPLWFMYSKSGFTLFWASERRMLEFIASGTYLFDDPYEIEPKTLYTWPIGEPKELDLRKLKPTTYSVSPSYITYTKRKKQGTLPNSSWPSLESQTNAEIDNYTQRPLLLSSNNTEVDKWKDFKYESYGSETLSPAEVLLLLDQGCAWCQTPKEMDDPVYWTSRDEWVCEACSKVPFITEFFNGGRVFEDSSLGRVVPLELEKDV